MNIGDQVKINIGPVKGRVGTIVRFDFFEDGTPKGAEVRLALNERILISTSKLRVVDSKSFRWRK